LRNFVDNLENDRNREVLLKTMELIQSKWLISDEKTKEIAIDAITGLESHGGNIYDFSQVRSVVEVVVSSWIDKK